MRRVDWNILRFEVTPEHIKLIREFNVGWQNCETGAPEIDPKRPYGNSYVAGDVATILGWPIVDGELSEEQESEAYRIHAETEIVLQIVLSTGSFEPGIYEREHVYYRVWRRV